MKVALVFNPFKYKVHEENIRVVQKYFGLFPPLSLAWTAAIAEKAGELDLLGQRRRRKASAAVAERGRPKDVTGRLRLQEAAARAVLPSGVARMAFVIDGRNGCFRGHYPDWGTKSCSWTLRSVPIAFLMLHDWLWQMHEEATGEQPPTVARTSYGLSGTLSDGSCPIGVGKHRKDG